MQDKFAGHSHCGSVGLLDVNRKFLADLHLALDANVIWVPLRIGVGVGQDVPDLIGGCRDVDRGVDFKAGITR